MTEQNHERRQHFRIDMEKELIDIFWLDENGQEQQKSLACLDFSKGGVKIDSDQAIAVNTEVTVIFAKAHASSQKLKCRVLRCVQNDTGWYHIAMKMVD